ncbi:RidA family protein [Variovorax sp. LjRoot178]|uniref:RidA family protein n=1 Tax=Variovorax sp. LjRoot178 TaxID=3342277 RepID=UPI003ED14B83
MDKQPRSLEVPGVSHGAAPIPLGARVGNVLYSSGIPGMDPETGRLPPDAAAQAGFAFRNMRALLEAGGATLEDVVRMTVYLKDSAAREQVNALWLECFPDPHDRPARHTLMYDLQQGMLLQLEVVAVLPSA